MVCQYLCYFCLNLVMILAACVEKGRGAGGGGGGGGEAGVLEITAH